MLIDKTTLKDLAIFENEDQVTIFQKFDYTITSGGNSRLRQIFAHPLSTVEEINNVQQTVNEIFRLRNKWPEKITNGTLMVITKFYETVIDKIPYNASPASALQYKLLHTADCSLIKYSAFHAFDFIKGMDSIINNFVHNNTPTPLLKILNTASILMSSDHLSLIKKKDKFEELSLSEILRFAYFLRNHFRDKLFDLIDVFYQLDAWFSMGKAKYDLHLSDPEMVNSLNPLIYCENLYHILLPDPVVYNVEMDKELNFIFLTGANMAGKSTFIKSIGIAAFLAHIGMSVPSTRMRISIFEGMLSNINVVDNISKGESYFFNEVQRIKNTVIKISDSRKWLVLIDELFKGTNVQDSFTCSTAVIKGLIKIKSSLFILSTHLYEIGEELKAFPNISFKYFETAVVDEQLQFSYQLQNGISNDRLGYLILKREKVIDLLDQL